MKLRSTIIAVFVIMLSVFAAVPSDAQVNVRIGTKTHHRHYNHRRPVVRERVVVRHRPVVRERVVVRHRTRPVVRERVIVHQRHTRRY